MQPVKVYGADWCPLTQRTIEFLERMEFPYKYIDIEKDPKAAAWVREKNDGKERKPTVDVDGEVLAEPSNAELEQAISRREAVEKH